MTRRGKALLWTVGALLALGWLYGLWTSCNAEAGGWGRDRPGWGGHPWGRMDEFSLRAPVLTGEVINDDEIDLEWSATPLAEGYRVYQDAVEIDDVTDLTLAVTGLDPETAYDFYVQAYYKSVSRQSNTVSGTTPETGVIDLLTEAGQAAPTAAWCPSLRMRRAYTDSTLRVRRVSDDKEFGYIPAAATGVIVLTALADSLDGTTGAVVKIFDQMNLGDAVQTTAANQPAVALAAHGTLPAAAFTTASSHFLSAGDVLNVSTGNVTILAVVRSNVIPATLAMIAGRRSAGNGTGYSLAYNSTGKGQFQARKAAELANANSATTVVDANNYWYTITGTWETSDDSAKVFLDDATVFDGAAVNTNVDNITIATTFRIGIMGDSSYPLTGQVEAVFVWTGTQPTAAAWNIIADYFAAKE